jgi:hypothetical protein
MCCAFDSVMGAGFRCHLVTAVRSTRSRFGNRGRSSGIQQPPGLHVVIVSLRRCVCVTAVTFACLTATSASIAAAQDVQPGQPASTPPDVLTSEDQLLRDIIARSFPTFHDLDIRLSRFQSESDYFRTSFSATRFLVGKKMRYYVGVNPEWRKRGAPVEGVRSILAHELAHIEEMSRGKRIRLFRLTGLLFQGWTARFERRADLAALARDYGSGLKAYRTWLYDHVPVEKVPEKRRDYFSPEEIDAILTATASHPELFDYWLRQVPMTVSDILIVP